MHSLEHKPALRAGGFTFKQFFVAHDRCAMKVGTDGVLLGAWAPLSSASRMLDIGCGSGLIALMLAQRSAGRLPIDAVELDETASQQARDNAAASPWPQAVTVHCADITVFARQTAQRYDLIVSNPPYFSPGVACGSDQRAQARYTTTLTHDQLLHSAQRCLTADGLFCVVLPSLVAGTFLQRAAGDGWHLARRLDVADDPNRPVHRALLALARQPVRAVRESLIIRDADRQYSAAYRALTQDFYLLM